MTRLTLAALLVGCAPVLGRPLTPAELEITRTTGEEWRAAGLPWSTSCDGQELAIAELDDEEFRHEVGYCASDGPICTATRDPLERAEAGCLYGVCSAGSVAWSHSEPWPFGLWSPWRVLILLSAYLEGDRRSDAIVHEYAHALGQCARGDADHSHSDPRVWGRGGVLERVRWRLERD